MNIDKLTIRRVTSFNGMHNQIQDVKNALEQRINLDEYSENIRPVTLNFSIVLRICLLAGLSDNCKRTTDDIFNSNITLDNTPYPTTFFTKADIGSMFEVLLKLRYHDVEEVDWNIPANVSKAIGREILRGRGILMQEGGIDAWLCNTPLRGVGSTAGLIPELNLRIGNYDNGMDAFLDINSRAIANTQVLVAGATGSGKTNLLAVLINQIRSCSSDSHFPVNFLLFDYKGEFSDPDNEIWLEKFDTDNRAILRPMERPLPFTPFTDFTGKPINEVNLYATTLSSALRAIAPTTISAKMENRLAVAIINAYKAKNFKPISFKEILHFYLAPLPENRRNESDSVTSTLEQLIRANLFEDEDRGALP